MEIVSKDPTRCDICRKPKVINSSGICQDCADNDPTLVYFLNRLRPQRCRLKWPKCITCRKETPFLYPPPYYANRPERLCLECYNKLKKELNRIRQLNDLMELGWKAIKEKKHGTI